MTLRVDVTLRVSTKPKTSTTANNAALLQAKRVPEICVRGRGAVGGEGGGWGWGGWRMECR